MTRPNRRTCSARARVASEKTNVIADIEALRADPDYIPSDTDNDSDESPDIVIDINIALDEFNPIEMYWGWTKRSKSRYRLLMLITNCSTGFRCLSDGKFSTGQRLLPEILDSCPVKTIRAFFRKSWRYMDAYRYVFDIVTLKCVPQQSII